MASSWKLWHIDRPPSAEERWALADRLATGDADPDVVARYRQQRRISGVVIAIVVLVLFAFVTWIFTTRGHHPQHHRSVPLWREIVGLVVTLAGIVVLGRYLLQFLRRVRPIRRKTSPLLALNRRERKYLMRQATGRADVDPARLHASRAVAEQLRRALLPGGYWVGMLLIFGGTALDSESSTMPLVFVVIFSACFLGQRWYGRRASAFLAANPAPH